MLKKSRTHFQHLLSMLPGKGFDPAGKNFLHFHVNHIFHDF